MVVFSAPGSRCKVSTTAASSATARAAIAPEAANQTRSVARAAAHDFAKIFCVY